MFSLIVFPQYEDFSVMLISFPCIFSPLIVYSDPLSELTRKPDMISVKWMQNQNVTGWQLIIHVRQIMYFLLVYFFLHIFKEISFIYLKWLNVRLLINFQRM